MLEDAPFGLAFTAAAARIAAIRVPITDACINVLSTLWGRPLAAENDLLPALSLGDIDTAALVRLAAEGYSPHL